MLVPDLALLPSITKCRTTTSLFAPSIRIGVAAMRLPAPVPLSVAPFPSNTRLCRPDRKSPRSSRYTAPTGKLITVASAWPLMKDWRAGAAFVAPVGSMDAGTVTVLVVCGAANGRPPAGGGGGSGGWVGVGVGAVDETALN